jgi:tetratricopeptide (TPR) repeat protein
MTKTNIRKMKKYIAVFALLFAFSSDAFSQSEPPFGMSEIQAYSIFYENFRTGNYDMALQFGKWMLEKKPMEIQGANRFSLPNQFQRMITVYAELSKQQTDPALRAAYIDTALTIYEDAFASFDENTIDYYTWHFNRGRFYQEHQGQISGGMDLAYEEYMKAFELDSERLTQAGGGYYIQIMLSNFVSKNDRDAALAMIDTAEPHAGSALKQNIEEVRDGLFSDPAERIGFLESRLANNPGDEALISEIAAIHERQGNRAKAIEYAGKLYEISKTFDNAKRLADFALSDAQYELGIRYLKEALELTDNTRQKRDVNLQIAETYQNNGNLRSARQYARESSRLDRNWGQPYLRIASIYAGAVSQCTSGRQIERDDRIVYWLVLDYLDRARNVDSSVAGAVQRQYRSYEPVLPSSEDKFFRGWETGDELQVGSNISECYAWINETTKVR